MHLVDGTLVAAWVQAIGSILAIVAAILIPRLEARVDNRRAADAAGEIANSVIARLTDLISIARDRQAFLQNDLYRIRLDLSALESVLLRFPLDRLESKAVFEFLGLIGSCQAGLRVWFSKQLTDNQILDALCKIKIAAEVHRNGLHQSFRLARS